jgi:subtilisin family serine protease
MTKIFGALLLVIASVSEAGNILHFQNGDVEPKSVAQKSTVSFANLSDDYVLQFKGAITELDKAQLKAKGVQIFRYIPDDALIVRATASQLTSFAQNGRINAFIPFKGNMKLSSHLPTLSVFSKRKSLPVAIVAFTATDAQNILSYLKSRDSDLLVLDLTGSTLSVRVSQTVLPELANQRGVEFVEEIQQMVPMHIQLDDDATTVDDGPKPKGDYTDLDGYETGTRVMNFDAIWAQGYHGQGQIVAMADTGLDSGSVATLSVDFKDAVKNGYSFGIGAKTWDDPMGHGTHVAGSVLGRGTASGGKLKGGAYGAQIVPEGMWSPLIDNLTVPPQLNKLFDAAYTEGARVHTNSWGAARNFGAYDAMAQQVDQFMWDHPDFLVVFAAGNSGVDMDKDGRIDPNSIGSPGTAKNTLTVGASENLVSIGGIQKPVSELRTAKDTWPAEPIWSSKVSDNADGVAMFSSRGPTTDGRIKPEIVAPGTNILSTRSHVPDASPLWGEYNTEYVYSGGTSMATPLTAGAAAVTREVLMKKFNKANPSAALVKATMMHTAHDMFPGQYGTGPTQELKTRRPNSDEGYGRVDMGQLAALTNQTAFIEAGVGQGEVYTATVEVKSGKLLANLVYTDAPGTPSAKAALVNDLNLKVVSKADGKVLFASTDAINNNEIAELNGLANGVYEISVQGTKVPMGLNGKQPFALVYTAL